ncbi:MAG: hypothetical protein ACLGGX_07165 [Bdellovibrionia bacterium]
MFQKIIETNNLQDLFIHTLDNGTLIAGFEVDLFDEEVFGLGNTEQMLQSLLRDLPQGRTLRIYLKSEYATEESFDHSRTEAIKSIGFVRNRAFVFLEKPAKMDLGYFIKRTQPQKQAILTDFNILKDNGIKIKPLNKSEIESIFPVIKDEVNHAFQTIDLGPNVVSVLRLVKQSEFGMDLSTLSHIKDGLPLPYIIGCSIQAVNQTEAETFLRRRSKQNAMATDLNENRKFSEAQSDLEDISLNGSKLFRFEWQCLISRNSEEYLRQDREEIKRKLEPLGEIYIESVGALESLKSFYPGEEPHFTLLEKDSTLITYMPLVSRGDAKSNVKVMKRSLALHRKDESLTYVNIFDPAYESFSWCIFGRPGTGKSVLTNAITRALVYDPQVKVIKIDVGGSHSRETEMLGGVEKTLNLNEPTGINPFNVIHELGPTKEAVQILAAFMEVLILEEGELKLSKTMKSDLERAILAYAEKVKSSLSLDDFYRSSQDLPRKELFQRWVGSGVYGNAFAPTAKSSPELDSNLTYFNFSKISQALDPDYAQGGLAAVMAQFNLEMLKKAEHKKKIVFIADETPFFIKKCFSFFNLSIANVRKEGHGFITVAQKSAHVVVDGDTGILDNSPNRIYFSADGDDETFIGRNQLTHESIEKN